MTCRSIRQFTLAALTLSVCLPLGGSCTAIAAPFPLRAVVHAETLPSDYAHGAAFTIPDGWRREERDNKRVALVPPDVPRGQTALIMIAPPEKPRASLRAHMEADIADTSKGVSNFRTESEFEELRHPAGYDMARQAMSWSSGLLAGPSSLTPFGRMQVVLYHIDGGKEVPSQPVMLITTSRDLMERYRPTFEAFVRDLRITSQVSLAPAAAGHPTLTLYTAHQFDSAMEWLLDARFSSSQRDAVHRYLVGAWERGDGDEIKGVREMPELQAKCEAMPAAQRPLLRQALRNEALKSWRAEAKAGDAGARIILDIYYSAHKPLAPGTGGAPALTREIAEAMLDSMYFMASMSVDVNGAEVHPPQPLREQWIQGLAAEWRKMPANQQEGLATVPSLNAGLRMAWLNMGAEQKAQTASQWGKTGPVKVIAQQIRAERTPATRPTMGDKLNGEPSKAIQNVNLYNQLSAYGALRINHTYIKW